MKPLLTIIVLLCPALSHAGNNGCRVAAQAYAPAHAYAQKVVAVASPYYFAVGQNVQIEAQVTRATQPLLEEIQALRSEVAAGRQEAKAGFSSLSAKFSFRGQGTFTVEGDGGGDNPIVPPSPSPNPPVPSADAAPALTPAVKNLFATKCAACHTGKATGFDVDKPLTASDAAEILARVDSDDPAFRMPKKGSVEDDRNAVRAWVFGPTILKLQTELKSRKGNQ